MYVDRKVLVDNIIDALSGRARSIVVDVVIHNNEHTCSLFIIRDDGQGLRETLVDVEIPKYLVRTGAVRRAIVHALEPVLDAVLEVCKGP